MNRLRFNSCMNKSKSIIKVGVTLLLMLQCGLAQSSEKSFDGLRSLQKKVKQVVSDNMEVTVSVRSSAGAYGSGVIVSKEGLILTAAHVISGAEEVDIIFPNSTVKRAKVLGANYSKDIAMCHLIEKKEWKYAEVAPSEELEIGEYVVAMGHAYGFDAARTPPVRFGRVMSKQTNYFLTTDCTLIGGDSGGPLYDLDGKVVGIHSNIGSTWTTNNHAGISGFLQDWDKLKNGERWGVLSINPMTNPESPVIGIILGAQVRGGVFVDGIVAKSPAESVGIKRGDVITQVNDQRVNSVGEFLKQIWRFNAGDTIDLIYFRGKKQQQVKLTLARRETFQPQFRR